MSVQATCAVWECGRFNGSELLVLLALADCANHEGRKAYPSVATLSKMARTSPRSAQRALAMLVAEGAIAVECKAAGRGRPTVYRVCLEQLAPLEKGDTCVTLSGKRVTNEAPKGDKVMSPKHLTTESTRDLMERGGQVLKAAGIDPTRFLGTFSAIDNWMQWLTAAGLGEQDFARLVMPAIAAVARRTQFDPSGITNLTYFNRPVRQAIADATSSAPDLPRREAGRYDRQDGGDYVKYLARVQLGREV